MLTIQLQWCRGTSKPEASHEGGETEERSAGERRGGGGEGEEKEGEDCARGERRSNGRGFG